jgi:tetratricopeptide (TPR) repeat protein
LEERLQAALVAGARDGLLEELLGIARSEGIDEVLLQAATSNLPVTPAGLTRMLAGDTGDEKHAERDLERLADLSLVHRFPDGSGWVHRWTAEGLARLDGAAHRERCVRAGRYRHWRALNESRRIKDLIEAVRNFLAGEGFDAAVDTARICFDAYRSWQQSIGIATLASEILETLPETHPSFGFVADQEAISHLALGGTESAFRRYEKLLERHKHLAKAEPERADYQRDLSVSHERMGNLYSALGQGEKARESYQSALGIRERLSHSEPERADYQRDLATSLWLVGEAENPADIKFLKRALAILESLKDGGAWHPQMMG